MKVELIHYAGYAESLLGLGLSHGVTSDLSFEIFKFECSKDFDKMHAAAEKLRGKGGGHDKFLRMQILWIDITAPRYWWSEFDTYKVGTVAQSESTMHTLGKRDLTQEDFEMPICPDYLNLLNGKIGVMRNIYWKDDHGVKSEWLRYIKNMLPEGFLQRRIVMLSQAVADEICRQRKNHRLPEWKVFCDAVGGKE